MSQIILTSYQVHTFCSVGLAVSVHFLYTLSVWLCLVGSVHFLFGCVYLGVFCNLTYFCRSVIFVVFMVHKFKSSLNWKMNYHEEQKLCAHKIRTSYFKHRIRDSTVVFFQSFFSFFIFACLPTILIDHMICCIFSIHCWMKGHGANSVIPGHTIEQTVTHLFLWSSRGKGRHHQPKHAPQRGAGMRGYKRKQPIMLLIFTAVNSLSIHNKKILY